MNGVRQNHAYAKNPKNRNRDFFSRRNLQFARTANSSTMHKIQFAKGVAGPREFWRLNSLPGAKHRIGCFAKIKLYEENARILFLALLILVYLCFGAVCFKFLEQENEGREKDVYREKLEAFMQIHCAKENGRTMELTKNRAEDTYNRKNAQDVRNIRAQNTESLTNGLKTRRKLRHKRRRFMRSTKKPLLLKIHHVVNCTQLLELLDLRGNYSIAGLMSERPKWDFSGAFYFVGTVISTIGFGMTTPRTIYGKIFTMLYGFLGCASCILFFNLFLERIVTLFANCLRKFRDAKARYLLKHRENRRNDDNNGKGAESPTLPQRDFDSDISSTCEEDAMPWRPSVYAVFVLLSTVCLIHISLAALVYSRVEDWTYFESVYFCFISFATIGFGDYVSSQQKNDGTHLIVLYRICNFLFLSFGCCCAYSLFNVASIMIRQLLNWIIKTLDIPYRKCCKKKRRKKYMGLGLNPPPRPEASSSEEEEFDQQLGSSVGLVSLKEFLEHNQASMLMMLQKQIVQSTRSDAEKEGTGISANSVGPMGILNQKFGNE